MMSEVLKEQLVDHLPQIRRVVSRIAKDEGVVDDLTQECCVRIIEKEELWKETDRFSQWVNTVVRNLTINFLSKERKRKTVSLEEDVVLPEDKEFSEEHIRWVIQQFSTLSKMQKKVLQMRYFQGMRVVDIAKELNISKQVVTIHSQRAIKALKKRAKTQGLLGVLLPWHWDAKDLIKGIVVGSKAKSLTMAIVMLSTGGITFLLIDKAETNEVMNEIASVVPGEIVNAHNTELVSKEMTAAKIFNGQNVSSKMEMDTLKTNEIPEEYISVGRNVEIALSYYDSGELKKETPWIEAEAVRTKKTVRIMHGTETHYSKEGFKTGESHYENGKLKLTESFYENGMIKGRGEYKSEAELKNMIWYFQSGQIKTKCVWDHNLGFRMVYQYSEYGELIRQMKYNKDGSNVIVEESPDYKLSRTYHKNGKLKSRTQFRFGLKHGREEFFYKSGKYKSAVSYIDGKKIGLETQISKSGEFKRTEWKEDGSFEIITDK